jgi:hypothetical protein
MSDAYLAPAPTDDTITLSSVGAVGSSNTAWMTASITNMGTVTGTTYTGPYTINASNVAGAGNPWFTQSNTSPRINLNGEGADIVVNGSSLVDAINSIKDRLNCLQINPELEKEWDELRALGDQYRKLEQQILDKQATWDRLKAMPKVDLD